MARTARELPLARQLVTMYGVAVAAEIVLALAFEQTMQPSAANIAQLEHLRRWPSITIAGSAAYRWFQHNNELVNLGLHPQPLVSLVNLPTVLSIIGFAALLKQIHKERHWRPDSPSDRMG